MRRMGPRRRSWERHVQQALDVARPTAEPLPPLPVREKVTQPVHESDLHSDDCPCAVCTTYQPHEITGNWHPSKGPRRGLYLVADDTEHERADDA